MHLSALLCTACVFPPVRYGGFAHADLASIPAWQQAMAAAEAAAVTTG